jgi:hypothetical protein
MFRTRLTASEYKVNDAVMNQKQTIVVYYGIVPTIYDYENVYDIV